MNTLSDLNLKDARVLLRVDFNVPLDSNYSIVDATRIDAAMPTIKEILKKGGSVVLMSHLGRPKSGLQSVKLGAEEAFSLKHLIPYIEERLEQDILFADDSVSEEAFKMSKNLKQGEVLLLENVRFYPEETKGDADYADLLSQHGQVYVNDAFGTAHRAHASTAVIAEFFSKEHKGVGRLMEMEIKNAEYFLESKNSPILAILGGAKVSDKIGIIEHLIPIVDTILIGGGMTYTFIKAVGGSIGNSLCEDDKLELANNILDLAKAKNTSLMLPVDSKVADAFSNKANTKNVTSSKIEKDWMGLDIGKSAIEDYVNVILQSKSILWNGPMGVFEMEAFQEGTKAVAQAVAKATSKGVYTLVGGGDSVSALNQFGLNNQVSFVSTGGGAMLAFLEGKTLPGIAAIES